MIAGSNPSPRSRSGADGHLKWKAGPRLPARAVEDVQAGLDQAGSQWQPGDDIQLDFG